MSVLDTISHSVAQTQRLGSRLAELLQPGDVLLLSGPLGSGKTSFTQGIAEGLGISRVVNSPTFVLVREYSGRLPLYHMDCYRLERPADPVELGWEEYFYGEGVTVLEWPERASDLPRERLDVAFKMISETKRGLRFAPSGPRYEELVLAFRRAAYGI